MTDDIKALINEYVLKERENNLKAYQNIINFAWMPIDDRAREICGRIVRIINEQPLPFPDNKPELQNEQS